MPAVRPGVFMIAALAVAGLLAGCGAPAFQVNGKPLREPEAFLGKVERQWRAEATKDRANLHKDARCYYAKPKEGTDLEWTVFCGPVRHYTDKSESSGDERANGVWDTFTYEPAATAAADEYTVTETKDDSEGMDIPAGLDLFRPDGATPPSDGDALKPPPPPPAGSGEILLDPEGVTMKAAKKPKDGRIITPKVNVTAQSVGSTDEVDSDDGPKSPAKGQRFVVAKLSLTPGPDAEAYDEDDWGEDIEAVKADPAYAIQIGNDRKPIEGDLSLTDGPREVSIVASVPKGAKPKLLVTAAGVDQTIDLTTGERGSRTAAGYYGGKIELGLSRQYASRSYKKGDFESKFSVTYERARLVPFTPTRGWAKPGRAWLVLETDEVANDFSYMDYSMSLDLANTTIAKDDKGKSYPDTTKSRSLETSDSTAYEPIFDVDAGAKTFKVTVRPTFGFTADDEYSSPHSGKATLDPMSFAVDFG